MKSELYNFGDDFEAGAFSKSRKLLYASAALNNLTFSVCELKGCHLGPFGWLPKLTNVSNVSRNDKFYHKYSVLIYLQMWKIHCGIFSILWYFYFVCWFSNAVHPYRWTQCQTCKEVGLEKKAQIKANYIQNKIQISVFFIFFPHFYSIYFRFSFSLILKTKNSTCLQIN